MYYFKNICAVLLFLWFYQPISAQVIAPYLVEIDYNFNIDYRLGSGAAVFHNQVVKDMIGAVENNNTPTSIAQVRGARVDGYHQDNQGGQYFSFDSDTRVNGVSVLKSDIIRCNDSDCLSFSYFFDSTNESIQYLNINAFTIDPDNGDLIFSISNANRIGTRSYLSADLIRYNGTDFELFYDATSEVLTEGSRNIDAVIYLPNDRFLVSFANDGYFNEIYEYEMATGTWSVAYTPLTLGPSFTTANISSLMAVENDTIFNNGFESFDLP